MAEEETPVEVKDDEEHDSKEMFLQKYFLQEWTTIKSILDSIVSNGVVADLQSVHKIRSIMDKYQEQGQLIEPYLESIISPLMMIVRSKTIELGVVSDGIIEIIQPLCIIIYSSVTVCGYKSVIKFFPHQVSDLELAVSLLEKFHDAPSTTTLRHESTGEMETKCVILLWLYILVLIPFDISSVDTSIANSNYQGGSQPSPLVLKILGFSKDYLSSAGPMRKMAGLLLSRLLTRPDMQHGFNSFIEWTHGVLSSVSDDVVDQFRLPGVVEALAAIFKGRNRYLGENTSPNVIDRNASCIHDQYMDVSSTVQNASCVEEEDMDVPEIIEEIIELLLSGLRDSDTIVRWSAAKGIGRITARLTSALADDVLSSIIELFSPREGDGSWHGGCLALAELARRGLLLPVNFPKVVPLAVKALHYDVRKGPHSIGSHVRDAAAYVCWAFGRAYTFSDMKDQYIYHHKKKEIMSLFKMKQMEGEKIDDYLGRFSSKMLLIKACDYQQKLISGVVPGIEKARLYRGKGGEIMRSAVSRFIECTSVAHVSLTEKIKRSLLDTINENLRHPNNQIQSCAVEALKQFVPAYLDGSGDVIAVNMTSKYLELLDDPNVAARRGSALAIGALPFNLLASKWRDVLTKLCSSCRIEDNPDDRDAEARVNAVRALDDYSVDNRGDVGSWVREAAMDGLERCTYILCERTSVGFTRTPGADSLSRLSNNDAIVMENHLFDSNIATKMVVSGLVISAGGLQDSLRKTAITALLEYLHDPEIAKDNKRYTRESMLSVDLLCIIQQYKKCDRVIVPILKTIEILLSKKVFLNMEDHSTEFCAGLLDALVVELKGSKDFSKLYTGISILGYIASILEPIKFRAFSQLLTFLGHRYPKIRKASADQVYLVLLQNGNLVAEDRLDRALEVISETSWEGDVEDARCQRSQLYEMAGLEMVSSLKITNKPSEKKSRATADENEGYSSLVGYRGF
ncbi:hypothetical protein QJS04_geneDACA012360 [Acorus gramineus]|uniref:Tubulin-specific chaperone D n=1 Tax=Acorus gramineus TaxID=55184 RepID=A0AAV9B8G0_ACOGR|nr:hypothetical protein QJS04_geneDACA012360 [Acorus gramineus]